MLILYCMRGLRVELSNTSNYCFISAYYAKESTGTYGTYGTGTVLCGAFVDGIKNENQKKEPFYYILLVKCSGDLTQIQT